ncbi:MAG: D-alanyl-D-alanine carboxypeptidase/D-alanyl-D-alanine-endopeptidase [Verrucomicrobiales bacterium]|nr:D-alanyl-D-alanine carboxypeptidase/D-alanyl-D-alanine-endopeptidase [Verrucomicrobiales bacterium]
MMFLFLMAAAFADESRAGTVEEVIAEVEKIQGEWGIKTALVGFCLIPMEGEPGDATGVKLDTGLVPASTMKAITTATALEILGPDFRFKTGVQLAGTLADDGTLTGDVVIRGGGDPTLGASGISNTFAKWQAALAEAGVKKIEGSVVGDASIYGTKLLADSWQWNDIGNYFGAGPCGLTFLQNQFYCSFKIGRVGSKAPFIGTDPKLPGIQFINEMRVGAAGTGDQGYIYGHPYGKVFYLRGTVPAGYSTYTIKGSLPDPAFFCARAFTKHLNGNGIPVSGLPTTVRLSEIAGKKIAERNSVFEQDSDPLSALLVLTNHKSNNLRAECIHRMVGLEKRKRGTFEDAARATTDLWKAKGIDMTGFYMADGSGLSRSNTVTPRQLALIHYYAGKSEHFDTYYKSLPIAGKSGTLRSIGRGSQAEGRVRAKSGTLDRIRNYSGYVTAHSGKKYAFAIFINNYTSDLGSVKSKIVRVWSRMVAL